MLEFKPEKPIRYVVFEVTSCRSCFHLVYDIDGIKLCYKEEGNPQIVKDEDEIQSYCKLPTSLK